MRNVNLTVKSLSDKPSKNCGKLISLNGRLCLHQHVQGRWKRRDLDAWGINAAVLEYLEKHGATDIYLYDMAGERTYHTYVGMLREYGTVSDAHDWGYNYNLPLEEWSVLPGKMKTPWIADKCAVVLQPKTLVKEVVKVKEEVADVVAQTSLF